MRIAIDGSVVEPGPSGARTRLLGLLAAYQDLEPRHDLVLFVRRDGDLRPALESTGVECLPVPPPPAPLQRWLRGSGPWSSRLEQVGADLFQAESLPLPRSPGRPMILTIHDLRDLELPAPFLSARACYARVLLPRALRRVTRVVAVSEHTRRQVALRLAFPEQRIAVVPNAPDGSVERVLDPERLRRFRRRHALEGRFLLALGHLERRKNLGLLVESLRRLRKRDGFRDLTLVLSGRDRGREGARLDRLARGARVPLRRTGPLDRDGRACALSSASCVAIPSLVEGFGIVPLEAMRAGCPVIASTAGALPEVLGDAALLVDPHDPQALVRALESVLSDPELAQTLVRRGVERSARYSWRRSAELWRDVHDAVGLELRDS